MTRANDAGFIVLDALLGATVLALAGTVILTIVVSGETRRQAELDRSVEDVSAAPTSSIATQSPRAPRLG